MSLAGSGRPASASPGWEKILDRPTPSFGAVDFVSDSEGWMVAGAGVLHTTDGGATWSEAFKVNGIDVDFADPQHGWVVGYAAAIYYTDDGGATWARQDSGLSDGYYIQDVEAVTADEAWAIALYNTSDVPAFVDSVVLHTTDAGATWRRADMPAGSQFHEVQFVGASGWLLGTACDLTPERPYCNFPLHSVLLRTTDAGVTWTLQQTGLPAIVHWMTFVDETHGWLSASACTTPDNCIIGVYRTTDGGATWTLGDLGVPGIVGATAWRDTTTGWVVAQDCLLEARCNTTTRTMRILRTDDGGITWTQVSAFHLPSDLQGAGSLRLFGTTLYLTGSGIAYRSMDEGQTWQAMQHPAISFDSNIDFVDQAVGYVVDRGDLLRTDDAGRKWQPVGPIPDGARLFIRFLDENVGFTTRRICNANACDGQLLRTSDGGRSWQEVLSASGLTKRGAALEFSDDQHGWLALPRAIAVTNDAGTTWTQYPLPESWSLEKLAVADTTHLWAAIGLPDASTTYPTHYELDRSSDGGQTWQTARPFIGNPLALVFVDRDHGWYIDEDCPTGSCGTKLFATTDGGQTWTATSLSFSRLYEWRFVDQVNGWASVAAECGDSCRFPLLHTADGGKTWTPQSFEAPDDAVAHDLDFVDARTGWFTAQAACSLGLGCGFPERTVLYHTTDAGGGPIGKPPVLPDLGAGGEHGAGGTAQLVLAAAGVVAIAAAFALRRRRG